MDFVKKKFKSKKKIIFLSFVDSSDEYRDNTVGSLVNGVRIQIIIQKILSFFVILLLPRYIFPRNFDIGIEEDIFYLSDLSHGDVIWCMMIGLIL